MLRCDVQCYSVIVIMAGVDFASKFVNSDRSIFKKKEFLHEQLVVGHCVLPAVTK